MKVMRAVGFALVAIQFNFECYGAVQIDSVSRGANVYNSYPGSNPVGPAPNVMAGVYSPVPIFYVFDVPPRLQAHTSHTSNISTTELSGTARVDVEGRAGIAPSAIDAYSFFDVAFTISAPQPFVLSGLLSKGSNAPASAVNVSFDLTGPLSLSYAADATISQMGVLDPGAYHLVVSALASTDAPQTFYQGNFDFDLNFVPEPSSLGLASLAAILGFAGVSRRLPRRDWESGEEPRIARMGVEGDWRRSHAKAQRREAMRD